MSLVVVGLNYRVDGMRLGPSAAGKRVSVEYMGQTCAIVLPAQLRNEEDVSWHALTDLTVKYMTGSVVREYQAWTVRIEVNVEAAVTVTSGVDSSDDATSSLSENEAKRVIDTARSVADSLIRDYLDYVRIEHHQTWLRSSETQHLMLDQGDISDPAGRRVDHVVPNYGRPVVMTSGELGRVSDVNQEAIAERLSWGEKEALAKRLLADARILAWPARSPDYRQAVLIAAIACEVKIKSTLTSLATDDQLALVELVLNSPRDVSVAAAALHDKALKAVCGRSLREDDKDLHRAVERLFQDRNKIAHRGGADLDEGTLRDHVRTADRVFGYLDQVEIEMASRAANSPGSP